LDAPAGAVIGVPGKTRRRRGLVPARRSNTAWRGERGAGVLILSASACPVFARRLRVARRAAPPRLIAAPKRSEKLSF